MDKSEFENLENELEFNNGVGDVLKQKETYVFDWKKTAVVSLLTVMVVILIAFGVIEIGKNTLATPASELSDNELLSIQQMIETRDDSQWETLPEDANQTNVSTLHDKAGQAVESEPQAVEIPLIDDEETTSTIPKTAPSNDVDTPKPTSVVMYRVIAGSFSEYSNAVQELNRLKENGFDGYIWSLTSSNQTVKYKVQVGSFKSVLSAKKLVNQLKQKQFNSYISKY
jgi:cell division protein FtsN